MSALNHVSPELSGAVDHIKRKVRIVNETLVLKGLANVFPSLGLDCRLFPNQVFRHHIKDGV